MKRIIKAGFMMLLGAAIWTNGGDVKQVSAEPTWDGICKAGWLVTYEGDFTYCVLPNGSCRYSPSGGLPLPACAQSQPAINTRPVPSKPSSYGAVALNRRTGVVGTSTSQSSKQASIDTALQRCGNGCELSTWYANQCMAYAYGSPVSSSSAGRSYIVMGLTKKKAEKNALSECKAEFKNCKVLLSECSLP